MYDETALPSSVAQTMIIEETIAESSFTANIVSTSNTQMTVTVNDYVDSIMSSSTSNACSEVCTSPVQHGNVVKGMKLK